MPTKSSAPYVAPEGSPTEPTVLFTMPPLKDPVPELPTQALETPPERDFTKDPMTPAEQQAQALANIVLAYSDLYAACQTLVRRVRPANKLKHNYFVCAPDLEAVVLNMDGRIAGLMGVADEGAKEGIKT